VGQVVTLKPAQRVGRKHAIVLNQEHVIAWLDQLPDLIVDRGDAAPARVDAELLALAGDVAVDAYALGELGLLDQVSGREEEISLAIDECQQAGPLTVALEQFQGGKDFQQMLFAAYGNDDCRCRQGK